MPNGNTKPLRTLEEIREKYIANPDLLPSPHKFETPKHGDRKEKWGPNKKEETAKKEK